MKDQYPKGTPSTDQDFFTRLGELFAVENKRHAQIVAGVIAIIAAILLMLSYQ